MHCKFAGLFGIAKEKCPPHWVHVYVIGLGSFIISLLIAQGLARSSKNITPEFTPPVVEENMSPISDSETDLEANSEEESMERNS